MRVRANFMHALSSSLIVSLTCAHLCLRERKGRGRSTDGEQWEQERDKDLDGVEEDAKGSDQAFVRDTSVCVGVCVSDRMRLRNLAMTIHPLLSRCSLTCQTLPHLHLPLLCPPPVCQTKARKSVPTDVRQNKGSYKTLFCCSIAFYELTSSKHVHGYHFYTCILFI